MPPPLEPPLCSPPPLLHPPRRRDDKLAAPPRPQHLLGAALRRDDVRDALVGRLGARAAELLRQPPQRVRARVRLQWDDAREEQPRAGEHAAAARVEDGARVPGALRRAGAEAREDLFGGPAAAQWRVCVWGWVGGAGCVVWR